MVIEHTLDLIDSISSIEEVIVVTAPEYRQSVQHLISKYNKIIKVINGGQSRAESTQLGLSILGPLDRKILIHDAVRPFVSQRIIEECLDALDSYDAIDVIAESPDTLVRIDGEGFVSDIPDRRYLWRGQTPQAFRLSTIRQAYELAINDDSFQSTDDCGVILRYLPKVRVRAILGSDDNMKITFPIDIYLADKVFQIRSMSTTKVRLHKADRHELNGRTVVIFGGSYGIGGAVAALASQKGAKVFSFSRTSSDLDITNAEGVLESLKEVYSISGRIDSVVVTAATLVRQPLETMDLDSIAKQINTNLLAPIGIAKTSMPYLEQSEGHLLLFTSSSYTRGRSGYSVYSSTKAAIVNLTQALAEEWSDINIKVNCLNPARTDTPMRTRNFGEEDSNDLLTPEEVADSAIEVLSSDLTGQVIDIRKDAEVLSPLIQ